MKIVTAKRRSSGQAVWLAADHSWATSIEAAEMALDEATEEKLERAGRAALLKNEVIDVILLDVALVEGRIVPARCPQRRVERVGFRVQPAETAGAAVSRQSFAAA